MLSKHSKDSLRNRRAPLDMPAQEFRAAAHQLVDQIGDFLESLPKRKVTTGRSVAEIKSILGSDPLPRIGMDTGELLRQTSDLLTKHSLFNAHPCFWGYVTSSAAPIGMLGDFLASALNANVGAWQLSPMASEIEAQTIRWLAEFIGYPTDCGGLMLSGGNMANFVGFLAARRAKTPWDLRKQGFKQSDHPALIYCSEATHTWVHKATDLFGLGTDAIRWIVVDADQHMLANELAGQIEVDIKAGMTPLMVVASAGTVATGAVDPIRAILEVCQRHNLWLHIDGAYGAMAAALPEADEDLRAIGRADSVALDPHKWLYSPLEAGCCLVRKAHHLPDAFAFHPNYYKFDIEGELRPTNYHEFGPQNSRRFRALKVWLGFRQVGAGAFIQSIREDIQLAQAMFDAVSAHQELEAFTCHLSIATFRFVPKDLAKSKAEHLPYLNELNEALLNRLQQEGEVFLSNAVLQGNYVLRACIVNFMTKLGDVDKLPEIVARIGRDLDKSMRSSEDGTS